MRIPTVQRLSVALQRGGQEDQLLRAHVRRARHLFGVNDGGAPGGGAATESVVARAGCDCADDFPGLLCPARLLLRCQAGLRV